MTSPRRIAISLLTLLAVCLTAPAVEARGKKKTDREGQLLRPSVRPVTPIFRTPAPTPDEPAPDEPTPTPPSGSPTLESPDPGPTPPPAMGHYWDRKNENQNQFILRGEAGEIANIAARYGLTVLESVDTNSPGGDVALLESPTVFTEDQVLAMLEPDESVLSSEATALASLPQAMMGDGTASLEQSTVAILEQSTVAILESVGVTGVTPDPLLAAHFAGQVWRGYSEQPAAQVLNLATAHEIGYGGGIVAVIDNGVDPDHPLLQGALVGGYDFILDRPGASEWDNLDPATAASLQQSTVAILEQSTVAILEGAGDFHLLDHSSAAVLDQSTVAILEQHELPPSFGHGTLVAGIIRLVAPGAQIMPLRAFDGAGTGNLFDIVRAVHYAVDNGADVINMSFSLDDYSPELARAIDYARRKGVVCVSAAGNQGAQKPTYPASFGTTIGVGSTNDLDVLSPFSNRGADLVLVSAPGEGVISTFPGGTYAAAWGTSFAAPFVAGAVALLHADFGMVNPDDPSPEGEPVDVTGFFQAMTAISSGAVFLPDLAAEISIGRLDLAATVTVGGPTYGGGGMTF